ncbi:MAG: helix-turn-helix domain-containing protein [Bacteroidetes bacterium]|nr:helix-turn-helix domain-containing protein [Bacteroidota bacterium]MBU1372843.1 helix-turn-helix domain-containing protein [Bacteroidota bacterium]MBU1485572.1 helix-turn-helix domain-containing protein [Bacteroidota bacterium]MBU1760841.1 helix-turn-helix domain-containing protein [Bacteroidota bacterium]MBU2045472.1 helix-turn-helix domain-containing protein [Bacteroidota bacterium]
MSVEIITKEDLVQFKSELLFEISKLVKPSESNGNRQWMKSAEVRKLLSISSGTLQNLRINGTLRYTKIGGTMYYKTADIHRLLEGGDHA